MGTMTQENREVVARALRVNYGLVVHCYKFNKETMDTIREMVSVGQKPYDPKNADFVGDTLDRHPWSCYGNNQEIVAAMTLVHHESVWPEHVNFARSKFDQNTKKVDLNINGRSFQVKTAKRGAQHWFVPENDLIGEADMMLVVDAARGLMYEFDRAPFRRNMKEQMDIGGPYDQWRGEQGWFVDTSEIDFVTTYTIPAGVAMTYLEGDIMVYNDGLKL